LRDVQSQLNRKLEKKKMKIDIWPNISSNFSLVWKKLRNSK
jgi:hypothetical protein